jgi:hypothetical protein
MQDHNLRNVGKEECKTKAENWIIRGHFVDLAGHSRDAAHILNTVRGIRKSADWRSLEEHLASRYSEIHAQFPRVDEDGYEHVGRHPFDIWRSRDIPGVRTGQNSTQTESAFNIDHLVAKATANVYSLTYIKRQHLIYHWVRELHDEEVDDLFQIVHKAADISKEISDIRSESDR